MLSILAKPQQLFRPALPQSLAGLAPHLRRLLPLRAQPSPEELSRRVIVPTLARSDEDSARLTYWERGKALARQKQWDDLIDAVHVADDARLGTSGGQSQGTLLMLGAQHDLVEAARDALMDGQAPDAQALDAFAQDLGHAEDHASAAILSMAHCRIASLWLEAAGHGGVISADKAAPEIRAHLSHAQELLTPHDPAELDAPSVAVAWCMLHQALHAQPTQGRILKRSLTGFRNLIALDPDGLQYMRDFGTLLGPAAPAQVEAEAQLAARVTAEIWGDGAYCWLYLGAIKARAEVLDHVDAARFVQGMRDILKRRNSQHLINEMAALCALDLGAELDRDRLSPQGVQARAALHDCARWLLEEHLQEVHPALWATTPAPGAFCPPRPPHRSVHAQGRTRAVHTIAALFADRMADGSSLAFSSAGMYRLAAL